MCVWLMTRSGLTGRRRRRSCFVARRLLAESVALVLVTRDPGDQLEGLPKLVVEGLRDGDARELLGSIVRFPLDERVTDRIVAETRGNPLALLELPRGLALVELAGGFGFPDTPPVYTAQIEESFRRRVERLPSRPSSCCCSRWQSRLATPCWCGERRPSSASASGLRRPPRRMVSFRVGADVRFRHPLVRSAVYRTASLG